MSTRCPVTGRTHRTPIELEQELGRYDRVLAAVRSAEQVMRGNFGGHHTGDDRIGDAWNHLHDAVHDLERARADVEANPLPIPPSEAGTYALVLANID